jgi:glycosyltransferase involved in cell wall biosynthesis
VLARMFMKSPSPLLCTSHGADLYGLKGILFNRVKRFVLTHSSAVSVVSRAMRKEVIRLEKGYAKARVIPMGVDLQNQFVPLPEKPEKGSLLFVGRLVEKKGARYLIEAIPHILKKHPHIMLRIAGDGPEKPALRKQVSELRADDRVQFLGAVENSSLPALYQSSDVVIFPSVIADDGDQEGFGLVLVEALGCECAVVVTDLPAMQDIITDGKTGIVVPQKNVRELAEKVVYLLDNPSLGRSLGKRGRQYVLEKYDWESIVLQYVSLMESMSSQPSTLSNRS